MPDPTEEAAGRSAVASYAATMSAEIASMARRYGLDTLGYLLEMARLEAEAHVRDGRTPSGRRS